MADLFEIEHALDAAVLGRIRDEMRAAAGEPATVLGSMPDHTR